MFGVRKIYLLLEIPKGVSGHKSKGKNELEYNDHEVVSCQWQACDSLPPRVPLRFGWFLKPIISNLKRKIHPHSVSHTHWHVGRSTRRFA